MTTEYGLEFLVHERLRELRQAARQAALVRRTARTRRSARARIGRWFIRLGTVMVGATA